MTLLVCATCPRYDRHHTGAFGRALKEAVAADGRPIAVRGVQCLGGCPNDGVIALDGPGTSRVRFSGLDAGDAPSIVTAALAYERSTSGDPTDWQIPTELVARLSTITPKRRA